MIRAFSEPIALMKIIVSTFSTNGGEIDEKVLVKLYSDNQGIPESNVHMSVLIRNVNAALPSRRQINRRHGHRTYFVKLLPAQLKDLKKILRNSAKSM